MFPDLAHKISLQWSIAPVTSQACPGSVETPELAISTSRDPGCVIVLSHPSIAAIQTFAPWPCIDMGRG